MYISDCDSLLPGSRVMWVFKRNEAVKVLCVIILSSDYYHYFNLGYILQSLTVLVNFFGVCIFKWSGLPVKSTSDAISTAGERGHEFIYCFTYTMLTSSLAFKKFVVNCAQVCMLTTIDIVMESMELVYLPR